MTFGAFCSARSLVFVSALASSLLASHALWSQEPSADPASIPGQAQRSHVLTSIQHFWDLSQQERRQALQIRFECDVLYYDPMWQLLWIQDEAGSAYVISGSAPLPIKAGQRIFVEGTSNSGTGDLSFEQVKIRPVGTASIKGLPLAGRYDDVERFRNRVVTLEALVDRQSLPGNTHLRLYLSFEGRPIYAWVGLETDKPVPQFTDKIVRLSGIYNPRINATGEVASLEIMVPTVDGVEELHSLAKDPRFALEATPIHGLAGKKESELVRVVGTIRSQEPGRSVLLRDDTGQVEVISGQTRVYPASEKIEAIGFPKVVGTSYLLNEAIYRSTAIPGVESPARAMEHGSRVIRLAAQVQELTPEEALHGHEVSVSGVVTWSHPESPFLFLQDSSGGVCIFRGTDPNKVRPTGRNVEVHGKTSMGEFAPVIIATQIDKLGDIMLPKARPISLEHATTGAEEAQWVEMRGYLRQIQKEGIWNKLELVTSAGNFFAFLPGDEDVSSFAGAMLRIYGVCSASTNERRQLKGIVLWVPAASYVQVDEAAPKDLFDVPQRSLASLGQFSIRQVYNKRLRVSGVVVLQDEGSSIRIQEGNDSLIVFSRDQGALQPGDLIEAVGFLGRQGQGLVLREASYRKTGTGVSPEPQDLGTDVSLNANLDGQVIRLDARVLDATTVGNRTRLTLQSGSSIFEALLRDSAPSSKVNVVQGSVLQLTGVYELESDEFGQPRSFHLSLRSPSDIVVISKPSWFTRGRILALTAALTVLILFIAAWVVALRRRVRQQTEQIRDQLKRETHLQAELERASKLESLGILAGGIAHDFNNLLTVVMGNLSLAALDSKMEQESASFISEAIKAVNRASDLTQQLLTFAKGGAPIKSAVILADVVREASTFALHGSKVKCDYSFQHGLWPADVDRGQIAQVVQNIVINAVQAMPDGGLLSIRLQNEKLGDEMAQVLAPGRYLKLRISDTGTGIRPENLARIFDPYFTTKEKGTGIGLATVHSIIRRHQGHISVESTLWKGTSFDIWLPAAVTEPQSPPDKEPSALPRLSGRVLVMDDEESIRRMSIGMLQKLGFEVVTVPDGSDAISAYSDALSEGSPFALVILDLTVPGGLGGAHALEALKQIDPNVKAIVSSGYSSDQVLANFRAHGFCGMVSKPYELDQLAAVICEALQR